MTKLINDIQSFSTSSAGIDKYHLADEKRLQGNPLQSVQNHYASPCSQFNVGIWQSEAGCWNVQYTEHEYCDILEGTSVITDANGAKLTVTVGDKFVIPAGFIGTWEVIGQCKKVYVIFEAQ
ncbi:cupin domain-containing protein [Shewanella glacialimarina]|jgi:hypothetical protein|uniref:cupin domain-containing protein n=1 Tax=Shewanella glacialimarina TaxID=2590884 RepID=UPI001CF92435|nr:cupin domain-containing protein [Shewanella glacialimarina]UCX05629.1 cupin domain-containing protein [Shewanella glacialimarina]